MSKFDKLKEAVYADRFDGRIKAIKEAFEAYEEILGLSRWRRICCWVGKYYYEKDKKRREKTNDENK